MENNFFKKDVYLTLTGLGYEFNINVPWYWTNWFLIVMTRMWCWLDWPRPTGDVSGCGRPRGHPSWDEHTPGQPSPAESRERERSRAGSRAKHYIRTRAAELYRDRTVLVTRRTISIALNLFCNQGIKCSSWGSMASAVHWSVFSLTINRAGNSLCPGPCRRISAPRLISCDWQLAFALIVRCWDCLLSKLHTPGLWLCCWLTWENNPGDFNANLSWENHATSPLQTNDLRARAIKYLNNLYQKLLGMFSVQIWFMPRY